MLELPPDRFPITASNPLPVTDIAKQLLEPLAPVKLPVTLSAPPVENTKLVVEAPDAVCTMFAATLADDPTPRLGVVMQLVVVTP